MVIPTEQKLVEARRSIIGILRNFHPRRALPTIQEPHARMLSACHSKLTMGIGVLGMTLASTWSSCLKSWTVIARGIPAPNVSTASDTCVIHWGASTSCLTTPYYRASSLETKSFITQATIINATNSLSLLYCVNTLIDLFFLSMA